jgi:hypothetical protein
MKKCLFILIIAGILPIYGQEKTSKTGSNKDHAQNTRQPNSIKSPSPPDSDVVINQETANCQCDRPENKPKSYLSRLFAPESVPNIGLLIAGVIGIIVAIRTLNNIEVQTKHTGIAAETSKTSADTALKNIQLLINSERAVIDVNLAAPTTYIDPYTGDELPGTQSEDYARYGIFIMNHGRTVARIIHYKIWSDCSKHEEFGRNQFKMQFEGTNQILLGANKDTVIGNFEFTQFFTPEEWDSTRSEMKNALILIEVIYHNVFDDVFDALKGEHKTSATFKWDARKEEPTKLPKHNIYT